MTEIPDHDHLLDRGHDAAWGEASECMGDWSICPCETCVAERKAEHQVNVMLDRLSDPYWDR